MVDTAIALLSINDGPGGLWSCGGVCALLFGFELGVGHDRQGVLRSKRDGKRKTRVIRINRL